jgi:hypothetical protein
MTISKVVVIYEYHRLLGYGENFTVGMVVLQMVNNIIRMFSLAMGR